MTFEGFLWPFDPFAFAKGLEKIFISLGRWSELFFVFFLAGRA